MASVQFKGLLRQFNLIQLARVRYSPRACHRGESVVSDTPFIFPQVIDATMRSDWRACPHRFFRRHVQGLVAPGEISIHLHFGGCLAKGLETARREFLLVASPDRALFNGCEAIIAAWGNFQGKDNPNVNEKKKSLDACILSLAEYFKTWPLESDDVTIHVHRGEPCIEFSFAVPIPGADIPSLAIQSYMLAASISSVTILKLCGASTTKQPRPCPLPRNGDCAASSPGTVGDRENTE
jgi:hypothetical protein